MWNEFEMEIDESSLPVILNGKYFKVVSLEKDKRVQADCLVCGLHKTDRRINGSLQPTSNFTTHLKVN